MPSGRGGLKGAIDLIWVKEDCMNERYFYENFVKLFGNFFKRKAISDCFDMSQSCCFSCITKAVAQRCSVKKEFLETSQNSQENTCARVSFLIKNTFSYRTHPVAAPGIIRP